MDDYIDRKKVIARFTFEQGDYIPEKLIDGYDNVIAVRTIKRVLREIPGADVAPVVHSYWGEYESFPLAPSMNGYPCMNCGMHFRASSVPVLNYCPNCGAKMDGEEIN